MTRPRLKRDFDPRRGLAAVALFVVMAAAFINVEFPAAENFGPSPDVTSSIGAAMFGINPTSVAGEGALGAETFLIAFEIVDLVLVAALVAAVMLARREDDTMKERDRS